MSQPEKKVENQILSWLIHKGFFVFKVRTTGVFDQGLGRFRGSSHLYKTGVSDIIGIFKGKFLAVEVKAPKRMDGDKVRRAGVLTPNQVQFQREVKEHGGIALTVTSVEELESALAKC